MKKIVVLCLVFIMLFSMQIFAFNFPTPDWGALLKEREKMVSETDFELYVEGSGKHSPYYGARLEPKAGAYIGMVADTAPDFGKIGSYLTYIDSVGQTDLYYPSNKMIKEDNVISTVAININSLNEVNYDTIRKTLDTLNSYNKPMIIRFANEMNCSSLGDEPQKYVEIFRNVANMIHEYPNFAVVWSPNDFGALDRDFSYYYPGDEYVDWVGVSCYPIKYFQNNPNQLARDKVFFMTAENSFTTNRLKPLLKFMQDNNINKPVMISEGAVEVENSQNEPHESWATPRIRNMLYNVIMKYPQVKLINYFNVYRKNEKVKFNISDKPYASEIFKEAVSSGAYITEAGGNADFVFEKASYGETIRAKDGFINLYTLAHIPGLESLTVNYSIDGKWYHSTTNSPYKCSLNVSQLSDGKHILKIYSSGVEKEYVFYKKGMKDIKIAFGKMPQQERTSVTDIVSYINGNAVTSFNYKDETYIIAEDLLNYQIDVRWNGSERILYIEGINKNNPSVPSFSKVAEYLIEETDIRTYIKNPNTNEYEFITSHNINGRTIIKFDELSRFGSVLWDGSARTLSLGF